LEEVNDEEGPIHVFIMLYIYLSTSGKWFNLWTNCLPLTWSTKSYMSHVSSIF